MKKVHQDPVDQRGLWVQALGRVQWVEGLKRIRITQDRITQARVAPERMT
ncbi:MAG: hypothetical protein L7T26_09455 [Pseudomonadales bacterium]|nr:hypothetical protein [Pseudomonadales bacterium]